MNGHLFQVSVRIWKEASPAKSDAANRQRFHGGPWPFAWNRSRGSDSASARASAEVASWNARGRALFALGSSSPSLASSGRMWGRETPWVWESTRRIVEVGTPTPTSLPYNARVGASTLPFYPLFLSFSSLPPLLSPSLSSICARF